MTIATNLAQQITDRVVMQNHDALIQQFHTNTEDTAIYLNDGRAAIVAGSALETAVDGWHRRVRVEIVTALQDILGLLRCGGALVVMGASCFMMMALGDDRLALAVLCLLIFIGSSGVAMLTGITTMPSLLGGSISRAVRVYGATRRADGVASTEYVRASLFQRLAVVDALTVDSLTRERRDALYGVANQGVACDGESD